MWCQDVKSRDGALKWMGIEENKGPSASPSTVPPQLTSPLLLDRSNKTSQRHRAGGVDRIG